MYFKALSGLLVCCTLLLGGESQVVITDAAPTEFPHIVKIQFQDQTVLKTTPGLFVSKKYVLTSFNSGNTLTKDMFDVTNQMGAVQTVGAYKADAINRLFYLKICTLFKGTPFNMSVSSFYALDDPVDAQLLFFNTTSDTLKKVSVQLINNSTCRDKSSQFGFLSGELTCMTSNETTNFCRDTLQDANVAATRITFSVVAIGGQVNGLFHSGTCDSQNNLYSLAPYFFYKKISSFRQTIIDLIPQVDIV